MKCERSIFATSKDFSNLVYYFNVQELSNDNSSCWFKGQYMSIGKMIENIIVQNFQFFYSFFKAVLAWNCKFVIKILFPGGNWHAKKVLKIATFLVKLWAKLIF